VFIRKKRVDGREYHQLVENYREDGQVRQRVLAHLGTHATLEEAIEHLPGSIDLRRRVLDRYPKSMQPGMLRRIEQDEKRLATFKRLVSSSD